MSDQNRDFQNQNGGYPNYGQPQYYQAPQAPQGVEMYYQAPPAPQGQPMYYQAPPAPQGQPMYYQAPPAPQGQPMYYQAPPAPQGQPMYYQAPPAPQGQPMYYQAPPVPQPAETSSEPEVILQTPTFEDYGFSANDNLDSGHDFGGFMMDNNTLSSEPNTNFFNAPTPNLNIDDVEANAAIKSETDTAMFNSQTPNLDISSVELAAKTTTESDREVFSNPMPIIPDDTRPSAPISVDAVVQEIAPAPVAAPAPEAPKAEAAAPAIDFMASMQSMFSSMTGSAAAVPVPPVTTQVPVPETPVAAAPVAAAPVVETPVVSPETQVAYQQPDVIVADNNSNANTIQDISSTSADDDKGPEYWAYMNQLLNKFDDGQVHGGVGSSSVNPTPAAVVNDIPVTPAAPITQTVPTEPSQSEIPVSPVIPVETAAPPVKAEPTIQVVNVPMSPKPNIIRDVSSQPVMEAAAVEAAAITAAMATTTIPLAEDSALDDSLGTVEELDDKALKKLEKARKAEEKAAAKAARAEARAAAKAEKAAMKAAKKNQALEDTAEGIDDLEDSLDEEEETSKVKRILGAIFPKKGDPKSEIIRKIVLIVAAVVFIGCMIRLGVIYLGTHENAQASQELSDMMTSGETAETDWSTIYNKYPNVDFPVGMQTKFADLYALNDDLVGWIRIPGLDIDYPVVQTEDDNYYLKRDYKGNKSDYGTIFVGAANNIKELDQNTVVYGHSMRRDVQMFAALKEYKTIEGFKKNPIIEFNTLYGDYKFKVYAVFISNGSTAGDNGYVFRYTTPNLANLEAFAGFVDQLNQRTLYYTGVDIQPDDKLITLSTCTYEFDNGRLAVVGRLIREGESEEVDTSKATVNPNPRYPQAWYDKNNQTNPYQTYANWVPTPAN